MHSKNFKKLKHLIKFLKFYNLDVEISTNNPNAKKILPVMRISVPGQQI